MKGWGVGPKVLTSVCSNVWLSVDGLKYEEAELWLAAAGAFVPVSKEPAPLLQASSPSINIGRVNTSTLLQPRYYRYNCNTTIT